MMCFNFLKAGLIAILLVSMGHSKVAGVGQELIAVQQKDSIGFLALGDSYTIGEGVSESMRWPNQLRDSLKANKIDVGQTKIIAQTGWTTKNLLDAIENDPLNNLKEEVLVSLLIGVNNQYQSLDFTNFQSEFDELLKKAIQIAGSKEQVFVVSIPDYGVTPFGAKNRSQIGLELDRYNAYMQGQCEAFDIPFVNITEISRELADMQGALAPDDLHPSGHQYGKWVAKILPVVLGMLED